MEVTGNTMLDDLKSDQSFGVLAHAANDSYLDTVDTDKWGSRAELMKRDGTDCLIVQNDSDLVVAFRGTSSLRDWLTDSDTKRLHFDGIGHIHAGFGHAWRAIEHTLLKKIRQTGQRIWLTGHSLGGALATVAAESMHPGYKIHRLVTFGSPRVFSPKDARRFRWRMKSRAFRVVHSNDLVPSVPTFFRYRHVGDLILIKENGKVVWAADSMDLLIERILGFRFDMGRDHLMANYLQIGNAKCEHS